MVSDRTELWRLLLLDLLILPPRRTQGGLFDTVYEAVVGAFVAPNPDLRSEADRTPVRVAKRNEVYYRKYPADIQRVSQDPCQAEHEQTFK
jgi:hypothetical protein